jgi:hypothetical protein
MFWVRYPAPAEKCHFLILFPKLTALLPGFVCPAPALLPGFVNAQSASLAPLVSDWGWIPIGEKSPCFISIFRKIAASVLILHKSYLSNRNSK